MRTLVLSLGGMVALAMITAPVAVADDGDEGGDAQCVQGGSDSGSGGGKARLTPKKVRKGVAIDGYVPIGSENGLSFAVEVSCGTEKIQEVLDNARCVVGSC